MSAHDMNHHLLRPCILQILRASGFHSTRPSVLDALVSITQHYLLLLGRRTAAHAFANHNTLAPSLTDVRMAMEDAGVFAPDLTAGEEAWREVLRRPLDSFDEATGAREKERERRDAEDLAAVRSWCEWWREGRHAEIRRVAGLVLERGEGMMVMMPGEGGAAEKGEDYLSVLKKKHSKTGEESRYQGTVLGIPADGKPVKIEGGPAESLEEWMEQAHERAMKMAAERRRMSVPVKMEVESEPELQHESSDELSDAPGEMDDDD